MGISGLIQKWSGINETSRVLIITDPKQKNIADSIKDEKIYHVQIEYFAKDNEFFHLLKSLKSSDLVMVVLSIDTYMKSGVNEYFTAFGKPDWIMAKYIFVRLDISKESLLQGLSFVRGRIHCSSPVSTQGNIVPITLRGCAFI